VQISAVLVINDWPSSTGLLEDSAPQDRRRPARGSITCSEILGRSVLERTIARVRKAGARTISVIGGRCLLASPEKRDVEIIVAANSFERWPAAQQTLREHGAQGIETVLMIGLGAYMEVNLAEALEFYCDRGVPLTQLQDQQGPLDFWVVDSNWFRTAASDCSLPFRYGEFPGLPVPCRMSAYVNRLAEARDLRRLVLDAFLSRCEIRPEGREVRPGIWIDDGARVHKFSRLVAPVYLGRSTRVASSAVITRFSNLERHCQVGEGTVVEEASVLPHTVLGRGLEVSQAVVDGTKFVDLDRNVAVDIDDPNLIRDVAPCHSHAVAHREYTSLPARTKEVFEFEYLQGLSRAAGRFSQ
jgi:carbonic anhydrase/acetyltransferase-like protein (isoleucine patch superfamily)